MILIASSIKTGEKVEKFESFALCTLHFALNEHFFFIITLHLMSIRAVQSFGW